MVDVNDRFHDAIIEACGKRRLAEEITRNHIRHALEMILVKVH